MQFVDECTLYLKAGNGGNGVVSWRREANVPEGGPYGGDAGDGGDIVLVGDHNINTLFDWRNHKQITAQNGENGRTAKETGKGGATTYINLPLGTSVYDSTTNELLVDILTSGQTYTICEGGKGGRGNAFFKSSFNRAPTLYENGDIGQERNVTMKLKYIADIGLVGLPNAGKSTFVGQVTTAKPRVANYQFTTIIPVLGVCEIHQDKIIFADLPGLIEGAAEGKGLGHEFLKHVERCSILIHLVSLNPEDNEDVVKAYKTIKNELKQYSSALMDKPIVLIANKIDVEGAEANLKKLKKAVKTPILVISAKDKTGLKEVLEKLYKQYEKIKKEDQLRLTQHVSKVKVIEVKQQKDFTKDLMINKIDDHHYEVISEFMKYWTNRIPLKTKDNIIRYNQKMLTIGVEETAKSYGAKPGDILNIYGNELVID
ncbi:MAG: GTPase ObgE [Mycoplasmataceae bacterium]|nr:GTPase ObgE [Mycoplasmataceae bacterium]